MKQVIVAISIAAFASGAAYAADSVRDEVMVVDAPFNWSGIYVGASVGYGWANVEYGNMLVPVVSQDIGSGFDPDIDGTVGGVQIGYNHQLGALVLGVEADFQFSDVSGSARQITNTMGGPLDTTMDFNLEWFGTLRGRMGVAATDRFLIYGTAGIAFGKTENGAAYMVDPILGPDYGGGISGKSTHNGWAVGAGAEYAFDNNWSIKGEYLYVDLGTEVVGTLPVPPSPILGPGISMDLSFQTVRVGINYRF